MNFKKAFTLLELLIVISIIGMLLYYIKGTFSYKNVEQVKFDTCYIHTYSKISKFMQDALLQKMVYSGDNLEKVNLYEIQFDPSNQKINFVYSGNSNITKTINYNGTGVDDKNDCYTRTYHTLLSGEKLTIKINPGLQSDINESPIKMYTGTSTTPVSMAYTGNVYLYYCQGNNCKEKYKLSFIPSTYLFSTAYCMKLDLNNGKCEKWSK